MCGIIGYSGDRDIQSVLVVGLERLSYRGYDSSGIAVIDDNRELCIWKKKGKIVELKKILEPLTVCGKIGIGHTRWATHGVPSDINSHPHFSEDTGVAVVHNGIIENHNEIKKMLLKKHYVFASETDSECIVHLIDHFLKMKISLASAVRRCMQLLKGSFAIVVISEQEPDVMVAARRDSPLLVGLGKGEQVVASDINAILPYTRDYFSLDDGELAVIKKDLVQVYDEREKIKVKPVKTYKNFKDDVATKGDYEHFMIKEIHEQAVVVRRILNVYTKNGSVVFPKLTESFFQNIERFFIQACGTSWHAGMIAKYWIETLARIHVEVDVSSEFRYRAPLIRESDVVVALSQSGETADTLACIREARSKFLKILSFVNVQDSSIDKESDASIHSLAGIEIGVASTKNYIAQLTTLFLFSIHLAFLRGEISKEKVEFFIKSLEQIPKFIDVMLAKEEQIKDIAKRYCQSKSFIFIGRHLNYPTALEGALKLKEISYIHATGYAAGELKHGPIALIDENVPIVCIAPKGPTYDKMLSNVHEVKSRKGKLIVIATEGDDEILKLADEAITMPAMDYDLTPIVSVVPLQLLAYHIAVLLGCDVDQPKNLAKSVTVE